MNCWEYKQCGREPYGTKVMELGACPAATDSSSDGLNNGKNGGRICWAITGTFCAGGAHGTFAKEELSCMRCDFYSTVKQETPGLKILKPEQIY